MIVLKILAVLCIIFLCLFALYVFVFVRPKKRGLVSDKLLTEYAHRGLHGKGVPENSLLAFEKAVNNGYGIELDVQLSKDGVVTVFHDYSLLRMTGVDKKLSEVDFSELNSLSLNNTKEKIPSFKDVLKLVNGKVPILVELKGESFDTSLCEKTAALLKEYKGDYCIESFNPLLILNIKKFLPEVYCGQLYTNVCRDKGKKTILNIILTLMGFNFLARPDFIAYNKTDRNSFPVKLTTKFYKAVSFVWTVKGKKELYEARAFGEYPIFEENE